MIIATKITMLSARDRFGIQWNNVQWSDLRKPLYSGLTAALFLVCLLLIATEY
jgi:hypothetical protein